MLICSISLIHTVVRAAALVVGGFGLSVELGCKIHEMASAAVEACIPVVEPVDMFDPGIWFDAALGLHSFGEDSFDVSLLEFWSLPSL